MSTAGEGGAGDGDATSTWAQNGTLCGNGDKSIISTWPGEDEGGSKGVVTSSTGVVTSLVQRLPS